jgi:hypothetical protein
LLREKIEVIDEHASARMPVDLFQQAGTAAD